MTTHVSSPLSVADGQLMQTRSLYFEVPILWQPVSKAIVDQDRLGESSQPPAEAWEYYSKVGVKEGTVLIVRHRD